MNDELGRALLDRALLEGDFVLRSGKRSSWYLDKYRYETEPAVLRQLGAEHAHHAVAGKVLDHAPVALDDGGHALEEGEHQLAKSLGIEALREPAERGQIAVIVVVVAEQHHRDRRQLVERDRRVASPARPEQVQRPIGLDAAQHVCDAVR